jgi:hypothetical protein
MNINSVAFAAAGLLLGMSTASMAQPAKVTVTPVGSQPSTAGPQHNFTGAVCVDSRF